MDIRSPEFIEAFRHGIRRYLVWWLYGLAIIEVIALVLRWMGIRVPLVSQVARDVVFGAKAFGNEAFIAVAYFFTGMAVHWFITWGRVPWSDRTASVLGALFWLVGIAYYAADKLDPNWTYWPTWALWLRYPPVGGIVGGLMAFFCFPQNSTWVPPRPW